MVRYGFKRRAKSVPTMTASTCAKGFIPDGDIMIIKFL